MQGQIPTLALCRVQLLEFLIVVSGETGKNQNTNARRHPVNHWIGQPDVHHGRDDQTDEPKKHELADRAKITFGGRSKYRQPREGARGNKESLTPLSASIRGSISHSRILAKLAAKKTQELMDQEDVEVVEEDELIII